MTDRQTDGHTSVLIKSALQTKTKLRKFRNYRTLFGSGEVQFNENKVLTFWIETV